MNVIDALLKLCYCLESTDIDPDLAIKYQFSEQLLSEYALASNQEYFDQDHFLPVSNQLSLSDLYENNDFTHTVNSELSQSHTIPKAFTLTKTSTKQDQTQTTINSTNTVIDLTQPTFPNPSNPQNKMQTEDSFAQKRPRTAHWWDWRPLKDRPIIKKSRKSKQLK